jgi:transcription factor IIIB subunit 2
VFLKFCKLLHIKLDPIDPSLYIHRFASMLEFAEKTQQVASTALRIVARMNREWMITGRRPAGICGAGLLIAAKMHKFRRTEAQIAQVVRICDGTLKKRLNELDETGALDMTSDEFHAMFKPGATADFVDVDGPEPEGPESSGAVTSSCAPPIVKQQRKKIAEAAKAAAEAAAAEEVAAAQLAAPTARGHQAASVQDALSGASTRESSRRAKGAGEEIPLDQLETQVRDALASDALRELDEDSEARRRFDEEHAVARAAAKAEALELAPPPPPPPPPPPQRTMAADAAAEDGAMRVLPAVEIDGTGAPVSGKQWDPVTMWDVDDDEIDAYIRTDGEAASREAIWNAMNREYLEHQEERARTAEVRGDAPVERKKRRRATDEGPASSAAEAAAKMIRQKNISNKINYALLKDFFGGDE